MIKWPKIGDVRALRQEFSRVYKGLYGDDAVLPELGFVLTPKLQGTNAAIIKDGSDYSFQSRNRALPEMDCRGRI